MRSIIMALLLIVAAPMSSAFAQKEVNFTNGTSGSIDLYSVDPQSGQPKEGSIEIGAGLLFTLRTEQGARFLFAAGTKKIAEYTVTADDVQSYTVKPAQAGHVNSGFEEPRGKVAYFTMTRAMPGWKTTDREFEIWSAGFKGVEAHEGTQFVELNAHIDGTLYQDSEAIPADSVLEFTFAHRGRNGKDTMKLTITDLGKDNALGGSDDTELFTKEYSTGKDAWAVYDSTTEKKILALGNTVRFAYTAVYGTGGKGPDKTEGNFLDAANFGVGVLTGPNSPTQKPGMVGDKLTPDQARQIVVGKWKVNLAESEKRFGKFEAEFGKVISSMEFEFTPDHFITGEIKRPYRVAKAERALNIPSENVAGKYYEVISQVDGKDNNEHIRVLDENQLVLYLGEAMPSAVLHRVDGTGSRAMNGSNAPAKTNSPSQKPGMIGDKRNTTAVTLDQASKLLIGKWVGNPEQTAKHSPGLKREDDISSFTLSFSKDGTETFVERGMILANKGSVSISSGVLEQGEGENGYRIRTWNFNFLNEDRIVFEGVVLDHVVDDAAQELSGSFLIQAKYHGGDNKPFLNIFAAGNDSQLVAADQPQAAFEFINVGFNKAGGNLYHIKQTTQDGMIAYLVLENGTLKGQQQEPSANSQRWQVSSHTKGYSITFYDDETQGANAVSIESTDHGKTVKPANADGRYPVVLALNNEGGKGHTHQLWDFVPSADATGAEAQAYDFKRLTEGPLAGQDGWKVMQLGQPDSDGIPPQTLVPDTNQIVRVGPPPPRL